MAQQQPPAGYQPAHTPDGYPDQRYYRAAASPVLSMPRADGEPAVTLYRNIAQADAELTISQRVYGKVCVQVEATLSIEQLHLLHAALGDALHDLQLLEADRERAESFARIQDEMRDADETGGTGVYYSHPDVHYVAPAQVRAKLAELEAAGAKRYIVLPDPNVVDATLEEVEIGATA